VRDLLGRRWTDETGASHPVAPKDVLVVSPYNARVGRLRSALPEGVEAGTVDKFNGD
jgi:uncharacterized protein